MNDLKRKKSTLIEIEFLWGCQWINNLVFFLELALKAFKCQILWMVKNLLYELNFKNEKVVLLWQSYLIKCQIEKVVNEIACKKVNFYFSFCLCPLKII